MRLRLRCAIIRAMRRPCSTETHPRTCHDEAAARDQAVSQSPFWRTQRCHRLVAGNAGRVPRRAVEPARARASPAASLPHGSAVQAGAAGPRPHPQDRKCPAHRRRQTGGLQRGRHASPRRCRIRPPPLRFCHSPFAAASRRVHPDCGQTRRPLQQRLPDPGASAGPRRRVPPRTSSSSETKSRRKAARATRCPRHPHREAGGTWPGEIAAMNCASHAITCAAVMLSPGAGAAPASIAITLSAGCGGIIAGSPAQRPAALRMSSIANGANRGGCADRPVRCDALKSHDLILLRQYDADSPFLLF